MWQKIINFFLWLLEILLPPLFIVIFGFLLFRFCYIILATLRIRPIAELNENALIGIFPWITGELTSVTAESKELKVLAAVFIAAIGLYFLIRRTKIAEQNLKIAAEGIMVERLSRAVDQIGNESQVRIGDILGLEKILETQEEQRKNIAQILSRYIRQNAPKKRGLLDRMNQNERQSIEVATKSLGRIGACLGGDKKKFCNLRETNLRGMRFYGIDFSYFQLSGVDFTCANLQKTNFKNAQLDGVDFSSADFRDAEGLTQEQLNKSYYREGLPPRNLPDGFTITERELN